MIKDKVQLKLKVKTHISTKSKVKQTEFINKLQQTWISTLFKSVSIA